MNDRRLLVSVQAEVYVDYDLHGDGMALVHGRLEPVLPNSLDSFFVQPHTEGACDVDVLGISVGVDDELNCDIALEIGLPGLVGKFGFDGVNDDGRAYTASDAHQTASIAAAAAWAGADAVSCAKSAAKSVTETRAGAAALGGKLDLRRIRRAEIHHLWIIGDLDGSRGLSG